MAYKWVFNPLTGLLEPNAAAFEETEFALKVAENFNVVEPASVGDLVVASATLPETVEPVSNNLFDNTVFGVIIEKLGVGSAKVLISGKLSGSLYQLAGLQTGKTVFVSESGKMTTTPPATGHLQVMGVALKSDTMFLNISLSKVVRP